MTWVAWRQQRLQILLSLGIVALLATVMVYVRFGAISVGGDLALLDEKYNMYLSYVRLVLLALPVLLGIFAGAPLFAREIEHGTHVFGLTQSIGRNRWWATKILVAGVPVVLVVTALGLLNAWASAPLEGVMYGGRMVTPTFEIEGLAMGAYTAAAFTLSAAAGLLVRNTLAAMVITVVAYIPMLGVTANALRPSYAPPLSSGYDGVPDNAWIIDSSIVDSTGKVVEFSPAGCTTPYNECLEAQGLVAQMFFQPDSRFWSFQAIESGVFALFAAAMLGLGAWALHKKLRMA